MSSPGIEASGGPLGNHRFVGGKGELLRDGDDVTLFGTGIMTDRCLRAAELLLKEGIRAEVVHLASIKPIDKELFTLHRMQPADIAEAARAVVQKKAKREIMMNDKWANAFIIHHYNDMTNPQRR